MNVLLTSAGRRSYLVEYFKDALKGAGRVIACNSTMNSTALIAADDWIESPLIYSDEYIPFLLDVIERHEIRLVLSLFDADLPVLAHNRRELEATGALVLVSSPKVVETCNDKWKTYLFLRESGIPAPATFLRLNDAVAALERGEICYPLVIKPRWGMGSLSIFTAESEDELRVLYEKSRRGVFESYLAYESRQDRDACIIIQEYIAGSEYGLDVVNDLHSRHLVTSVKRKIGMRGGETDGAITVKNEELSELGRKLGTLLGHIGNLDVDVLEKDGCYHVLEMNARFGGGYPFSHLAGMDLPAEILRWCSGSEADATRLSTRVGVVAFKAIEPRISTIHPS